MSKHPHVCDMRTSAKIVVWILGIFLHVAFLSGICMLIFLPADRQPSEAVLTVLIVSPVSAIIGSLVGVLAGTEKTPDVPQNVKVVNKPNEEVPVTEGTH